MRQMDDSELQGAPEHEPQGMSNPSSGLEDQKMGFRVCVNQILGSTACCLLHAGGHARPPP